MKSWFVSSFIILLLLAFLPSAEAQVTYAEDIAPIIYQKCGNCHRPGEIGPFSLTNYEEVRNNAQMIKYVTEIGYMPPWKPDPDYSHFQGESYLTDFEIEEIAEWVDGGMERGDISVEPEFPDYPEGSLLGEPDLVLEMSEAHLHRGNNRDSYYYFVLPTGLTQDRLVKAVEFRPGNPKIVHHALIFEDTEGIARNTDSMTPEYGFEGFGSFNGNEEDISFIEGKQFQPYAPGQKVVRYPDGMGRILSAGSDLAVQIHYAPSSADEWDQSTLNIFFAEDTEPVDRIIDHDVMLPFDLIGGQFTFFISGGEEKEFIGLRTITSDISLLGIFPHCHLLGKKWEVYLEHTDGTTSNLISIPDWDFNWQSQYYFNRLIKAEAGSRIVAKATYDNTSNNPNNPSDPPQFVTWGEGTEEEMFYLPIVYVPYREGDEDIVFDPSLSTDNIDGNQGESILLPLYPNPVEARVRADFFLKKGMALQINVFDIEGQLVRELRNGEYFGTGSNSIDFVTNNLETGTYVLQLLGKDLNLTQKFVKVD